MSKFSLNADSVYHAVKSSNPVHNP